MAECAAPGFAGINVMITHDIDVLNIPRGLNPDGGQNPHGALYFNEFQVEQYAEVWTIPAYQPV